MRDLNAKSGIPHALGLGNYSCERRFIVVRIQAQAAVGDAAMPLDMRGLHDYKRRPRMRHHAEMHQMPVVRAAVIGGILAHRGDDDAVRKLETGQATRRKKSTHVDRTLYVCGSAQVSAVGWTSGRR